MTLQKLFYDLYATHKSFFGKRSKRLMEKYADCLKQHGLDFTIIGERPVKYWDGEQFILEDSNLKALFLGDTYVIAKDFSFLQQDENSR